MQKFALLFLFAWNLNGQTANEYTEYEHARNLLDSARKMIREGEAMSRTPNMKRLDGVESNEAIRQSGSRQVANGELLAKQANAILERFAERQKQLRGILANPNRVLELESADGRKATMGIESIAPPLVSVIRNDLRVNTMNFKSLAESSQNRLYEMATPRIDILCETNYGAHFFPIVYLAKVQTSERKKSSAEDLPSISLVAEVKPRQDNMSSNANLRFSISSSWAGIEKINKEIPFNFAAEKAIAPVEIPLRFNAKELMAGSSDTAPEFEIQIHAGDRQVHAANLRLHLHSLNDLPLYIREPSGRILDTKYLAACYVDETLPKFEEIKSRALAKKIVNSFGGSTDDIQSSEKELFAVWYHLATSGVKYSNATETGVVGGDYASQSIRFPSEVDASLQANCVDGSIYIASFALSIGLDPVLIIRPGHMYLAVRNSTRKYTILETTLLGEAKLNEAMTEDEILAEVRRNYTEAQATGRKTLDRDMKTLDKAILISRYYPDAVNFSDLARRYQFIDVRAMREAGIPVIRPN